MADMWCNSQLVPQMREWARELGFSQIGVAGVDLSASEPGLMQWLAQGFHGDMHYMAAHGLKRARPAELVPGTVSVITARMDYLPRDMRHAGAWRLAGRGVCAPARPQEGIVSVYARGRDYHKVLRARLQKLSDRIAEAVGPFWPPRVHRFGPGAGGRAGRAQRPGLARQAHAGAQPRGGLDVLLGEIYVDMALPPSEPVTAHCGSCSACIDVCPTQAIVAPHRLDARRCISYLTIEHAGPSAGAAPADGQPHLRLRRLPAGSAPGTSSRRSAACRILTSARAWRASSWCICLPGTRPPSCA
jgi:epoxyqueuosine reductase